MIRFAPNFFFCLVTGYCCWCSSDTHCSSLYLARSRLPILTMCSPFSYSSIIVVLGYDALLHLWSCATSFKCWTCHFFNVPAAALSLQAQPPQRGRSFCLLVFSACIPWIAIRCIRGSAFTWTNCGLWRCRRFWSSFCSVEMQLSLYSKLAIVKFVISQDGKQHFVYLHYNHLSSCLCALACALYC